MDFGCGIDLAHVSGHFQHFLKFDIFDQKIWFLTSQKSDFYVWIWECKLSQFYVGFKIKFYVQEQINADYCGLAPCRQQSYKSVMTVQKHRILIQANSVAKWTFKIQATIYERSLKSRIQEQVWADCWVLAPGRQQSYN